MSKGLKQSEINISRSTLAIFQRFSTYTKVDCGNAGAKLDVKTLEDTFVKGFDPYDDLFKFP